MLSHDDNRRVFPLQCLPMIISHSRRFVFVKTKKTAGTSIELFLAPFCDDGDVVTPISPEDEAPDHRPRNFRGFFNPVPELFGYLYGTGRGFGEEAVTPRVGEWRDVTGGGVLQPLGQVLKGKRYYNHIPAFRAAARLGRRMWREYFTFTVERNPWDKALSQYYWKARRRPGYTFAEFIAEADVGVNYPRYCHPATGVLLVDRIVYFHELDRELGDICRQVGVPWPGSLPVRAKGATRTDRKPYQELFAGELAPYRGEVERLFAVEISLHGWDFDSGLPGGKEV